MSRADTVRDRVRDTIGSPGAVAHAVLLGWRRSSVRGSEVRSGDRAARRLVRTNAPVARGMRPIRLLPGGWSAAAPDGFPSRCATRGAVRSTLSGPAPQGHSLRLIHYSPVLPVQSAGGEDLR